jgi:carbon monoxide dehydrogenase subunit G
VVAEDFDRSFAVVRPPIEAWEILLDVGRVSGWVSVVADVAEVDRLSRYTAVLEDRMGPFKLRADLDIVVTSVTEGVSITLRADGEDRQIGSRITVDATLALDPSGQGCGVRIDGRYEVTGRVATMGASMIRQKADKILAEFVTAAQRELL